MAMSDNFGVIINISCINMCRNCQSLPYLTYINNNYILFFKNFVKFHVSEYYYHFLT